MTKGSKLGIQREERNSVKKTGGNKFLTSLATTGIATRDLDIGGLSQFSAKFLSMISWTLEQSYVSHLTTNPHGWQL